MDQPTELPLPTAAEPAQFGELSTFGKNFLTTIARNGTAKNPVYQTQVFPKYALLEELDHDAVEDVKAAPVRGASTNISQNEARELTSALFTVSLQAGILSQRGASFLPDGIKPNPKGRPLPDKGMSDDKAVEPYQEYQKWLGELQEFCRVRLRDDPSLKAVAITVLREKGKITDESAVDDKEIQDLTAEQFNLAKKQLQVKIDALLKIDSG